MDIIIYGAQGYALGVYNAIKVLYPERNVPFFMVTSMDNNADTLGGIPVREIISVSNEFSDIAKRDVEVLIATPENVQAMIEDTLEKYSFTKHTRITSEKWDELMRRLNSETGDFPPLANLPSGSEACPICVYMAKSHVDKSLKNSFVLPSYTTPIQVGASNTEAVIADIRDDIGDNISAKNGNYSELTGLYWVWKNVLRDDYSDIRSNGYYGFAQYRRMLILSDEDLSRLGENDVDVVLPYPLMYEPDINAHHDRYLKEADWDALLRALKDLQPEYAGAFPVILEQQYMYNYNVILAKRDVLRDYCEWLFPILERTEELSDPKGSNRSDRYIGYMGETLETLYFMKNREKLKVVHTGCRLLV